MTPEAGVVLAYLEALGGEDAERIVRHVAETFENQHLTALGEGSSGRHEYRRRLPAFLADFANRSYLVEELTEQVDDEGVTVVVRYRFEAIHEGVELTVPGIAWFRVEQGKIMRRIDSWDSLTVLRQLEGDA